VLDLFQEITRGKPLVTFCIVKLKFAYTYTVDLAKFGQLCRKTVGFRSSRVRAEAICLKTIGFMTMSQFCYVMVFCVSRKNFGPFLGEAPKRL
jgi:hypothetical protein